MMGRTGPHCVFARLVCRGSIAGWIGVAVPVSVIVCANGRLPSVAGDGLVGFPRLGAAAAAEARGE